MRELTKTQNYIFAGGALLMVIGVGCMVFGVMIHLSAVVFAIGATTFALLQMSQRYDGPSLTIRRLRTLMVLGDISIILSALLAVENAYRLVLPLFLNFGVDGYNVYAQYIHNNWVIPLLIGAIFELYTTHRITNELNKAA